jgi:serine/threonine protein kinase
VAGKGGFGRVFYAQKNDGSNFRVAIKKMSHVKPRDKCRNYDEMLALRDHRHPSAFSLSFSLSLSPSQRVRSLDPDRVRYCTVHFRVPPSDGTVDRHGIP